MHAEHPEAARPPRVEQRRLLRGGERGLADREQRKHAWCAELVRGESRTSSTTDGASPAISASSHSAVVAWPRTPCTPAGPSA